MTTARESQRNTLPPTLRRTLTPLLLVLAAHLGACDDAATDADAPRSACCNLDEPSCAADPDADAAVELLESMGVDIEEATVELDFEAACAEHPAEGSLPMSAPPGSSPATSEAPFDRPLVTELDPQTLISYCSASGGWKCCCRWDDPVLTGCRCTQCGDACK